MNMPAPADCESPSAPGLTPVAGPWRPDTLLGGVMILLTLTCVQRLIGFVRAVLFCRWLDAEQLGRWDMAFGFLMLAGPVALLALPGAFGRYAEHFRQRGQLRAFLLRTLLACLLFSCTAVAIIALLPGVFSRLIFGEARWHALVLALAGCLWVVTGYNYCISLFTALRCVRWSAVMGLVNGVTFAALGVFLLLSWRCDALAVVLAYAGSCLLCVIGAALGLRILWRRTPPAAEPLSPGSIWSKMAPFAAWILLINLLTNLLGIADRYMLVHFGPGSATETLALVGQYHSSRVAPLLMVSVASMLGMILLPHLSHDWETGRRGRVGQRMNLFLKLLTYGMLAASVVVLVLAPLLFNVAFLGKFAGGLAVLPWTLTYCVWFGVALVAQQYLWCVERPGLVALAMAVGLAVNVGMNLLLLPVLGLLGAVLAATTANAVTLTLVLGSARRLGWRTGRGLIVLLAAVPVLCLGPGVAAAVLLLFAWEAWRSNRLLSAAEKELLAEKWRRYQELLASVRAKVGGRWSRVEG